MSKTSKCPDCKGPTRVRSSREVTILYRQQTIICIDPECGGTYGAEVSITHRISPSARPDPSIDLRMAPPRQRKLVPANDDHASGPEVPLPLAANDDEACPEAVATGA